MHFNFYLLFCFHFLVSFYFFRKSVKTRVVTSSGVPRSIPISASGSVLLCALAPDICFCLQVMDFYGHSMTVRMLIIYCYPPLLLLSLIKDLKLLTPFSTISNFAVMLGLYLVFFYLIEDDAEIDDSKLQMKGIKEIPVFIGITLFALEAVGVVSVNVL